ncbi:restriction endonuclease [Aquibacillus kalidii]|uniref:restriction endonuclease n=1 Tax=Aquibacillus kalidii TaxID=2762597 RepID=UPI001F24CA06|nr:restriction endonuclease [Aquibacillus kalidii]
MGFFDGLKMGIELLWNMLSAEPKFTISLIVIIVSSLVITYVIESIKENRLRKSGMLDVDKMKGRVFEEYLRVLLKLRGYSVTLTTATGDYGADLILTTKEKKKIIVQAKRYKNKVGIKSVQEVASAKSHYNADECWVITNSFYTEPARKLAVSNHVRLIDRKELMKWMLEDSKVTNDAAVE